MDFNTFLIRLGINPSNFSNRYFEPIKTNNGFIYEVEQSKDNKECPYCSSDKDVVIKDYDYVEINCSETDHFKDILRIKKVRFKCKKCNRTFTPSINGIDRYSKTSLQTISLIIKDFTKLITFKDIGLRYNLTTSRILQIFDERIKFVPRKKLPSVLCIDEKEFDEEINQKYVCVLYDYENKDIVDVIRNRQLPYLEEYFNNIKEDERNKVKYFICDMYEGYKTICHKYFKKALLIVDLFHVIKELSRAVNKIRVNAMHKHNKESVEYSFMKRYWRFFLCRKENIPNKTFTSKKTGETYNFDDLVFKCVLNDKDLLSGYNVLQDLFHYREQYYSFYEALNFVDIIVDRLLLSGNELLETVGYTYRRWRVEIANGISKSQSGKYYTNAIAEGLNNQIGTIIKTAYGYHNFDRFRKRVMMIITYKKDLG